MDTVSGALDQAATVEVFTRTMPKTTGARVRYLLAQEHNPNRAAAARAVAARLGVTQRTVERWRDGLRKTPPPALAQAIAEEVRQRWQPKVRQRAIDAARANGITVAIRGTFGYTADTGTTDEARERRISRQLGPDHAAVLLDLLQDNAPEHQLRQALADALRADYFQDGGRRAHQLTAVELTSISSVQLRLG
ncbi:MAG: terminal protein TpgA1 [Streptomycetaceae bacterium]|nr:terminal protein TpgA1 [Streptomycetaceae bacterium]